MIFLDFHETCASLVRGSSVRERVQKTAVRHPGVFAVAIGGFPVVRHEGVLTWCGSAVNVERVRAEILAGLGLSAVPTFMNKSGKSLSELGELCARRKHTWAYRWMTLSLLFVGYGLQAELAFARDGNFAMSWPVLESPTGEVFIASANLSAWGWFAQHANDGDFDESARRAMRDATSVLAELLPEGT